MVGTRGVKSLLVVAAMSTIAVAGVLITLAPQVSASCVIIMVPDGEQPPEGTTPVPGDTTDEGFQDYYYPNGTTMTGAPCCMVFDQSHPKCIEYLNRDKDEGTWYERMFGGVSNPHFDPVVHLDGRSPVVAGLDADRDGISDGIDLCLNHAHTDNGDLDGDGVGNPCDDDRDGDGVHNAMDACPDDGTDSCVQGGYLDSLEILAPASGEEFDHAGPPAPDETRAPIRVHVADSAQPFDWMPAILMIGIGSILFVILLSRVRRQ